MPDIEGLEYLVEYLFRMGPASKDGPLEMREVQSWAPVLTGYDEWPGWQAELFVRLSREYCGEQHRASKRDAEPPWPEAVKMWRWVQNQKAEKSWDREEKRAERQAQRAANQKG